MIEIKDIHGEIIKPGQIVTSAQKPGGILSPGEPKTGIVEETTDAFNNKTLRIRYREPYRTFDQFILLEGKINEIVKPIDHF